jgi:putative endonuclease
VSKLIGDKGEDRAIDALFEEGYEIVGRNYHCRRGEIDIIAMKDDYICFVEVKYRNPRGYGSAADAITRAKMGRILMTARNYLLETEQPEADYRVDAVLIDGNEVQIVQNIYTQGMNDV